MVGEIAALTAALLWALSSIVYSSVGQKIFPLQLNLFKGIVAIVLIFCTLSVQKIELTDVNSFPLALLILSGCIGIGLGDTAYFYALNNLGARKTLILETLAPPLSALLAFMTMGEVLSSFAWYGIVLTMLGVIVVISEQTPNQNKATNKYGIVWGLLAAIAQSIGAVFSRLALVNSEISPLESSLIRLIAGSAISLILILIPKFSPRTNLKRTIKRLSIKTIGVIILASFGSTYLGIWFQQISLKFASAGIAQTLLSTSPLFVIFITLIMGEKVALRSLIGAFVAIAGIGLLFTPGI